MSFVPRQAQKDSDSFEIKYRQAATLLKAFIVHWDVSVAFHKPKYLPSFVLSTVRQKCCFDVINFVYFSLPMLSFSINR